MIGSEGFQGYGQLLADKFFCSAEATNCNQQDNMVQCGQQGVSVCNTLQIHPSLVHRALEDECFIGPPNICQARRIISLSG